MIRTGFMFLVVMFGSLTSLKAGIRYDFVNNPERQSGNYLNGVQLTVAPPVQLNGFIELDESIFESRELVGLGDVSILALELTVTVGANTYSFDKDDIILGPNFYLYPFATRSEIYMLPMYEFETEFGLHNGSETISWHYIVDDTSLFNGTFWDRIYVHVLGVEGPGFSNWYNYRDNDSIPDEFVPDGYWPSFYDLPQSVQEEASQLSIATRSEVVTPVPEPSTIVLFALGAVGVVSARKRNLQSHPGQ